MHQFYETPIGPTTIKVCSIIFDGSWLFFLLVVTISGVIALTVARKDFNEAWESVKNLACVDYLAIGFAFVGLTQVWYMWQMAKHELPPRWNPAKRQALQNLAPIIAVQYNKGRVRTGLGGIYEREAEFMDQMAELRSHLMDLGFDNYPTCIPGDRDWFVWVGFLEALLPLARKGNLDAALKLQHVEELVDESQDRD